MCESLKTIYATDKFVTTAESQPESMFWNCMVLTGGTKTSYDGVHYNSDYACIDNAPTKPGYFTAATV